MGIARAEEAATVHTTWHRGRQRNSASRIRHNMNEHRFLNLVQIQCLKQTSEASSGTATEMEVIPMFPI